MIRPELTDRTPLATRLPMREQVGQGRNGRGRGRDRTVGLAAAMLVAGSLAMGGCISVNAPDKPIVIELNINIKQDVVVRLAPDAEKTIEKNPEIF